MKVFLSCLLLSLAALETQGQDQILSIDGSGTTNPSRCYWSIMEKMTAQAKLPFQLTYRAVGSTTGQAEFSNNFANASVADFGSGDLPINSDNYAMYQSAGIEIVHLPVLLGAVSIFHSVPVQNLNLTGCLLAQIFKRDITNWNDGQILEVNDGLRANPLDLPINVVHRVRGSSSTSSTTAYLREVCPDVWSEDLVGSTIDWDPNTEGCEGSGGVTTCIENTQGSIGYIDAGHGISAGLSEIHLENADGKTISSQQASDNGGIAAAEEGALPEDYTGDFGDVNLLNRPGAWTWPIVQITYIYVRTSMTSIMDPQEMHLLKAFLQAVYDPNFNDVCVNDFGFTLPQDAVRTKALDAIANTIEPNIPGGVPFSFEQDTLAIEGAGDFVISAKRQNIADVQLQDLREDFAALTLQVSALRAIAQDNQATIDALETRLETMLGTPVTTEDGVARESSFEFSDFGDKEEGQLQAALVLAAISFVLWCLFIIYNGAKLVSGK